MGANFQLKGYEAASTLN